MNAREKLKLSRDFVATYAVQLYVGGMFTAMSVLRLIETNEIVGGWWWSFLYAATAHLIATGLIWPESDRLAAAIGATVAVISGSRLLVILQAAIELYPSSPERAATLFVAALLWGTLVILGLRWPKLTIESQIRMLLKETKQEAIKPKKETLDGMG